MAAVKSSIAAAAEGMPLSPWQDKEIAGAKSSFMSTPLGIGLYIAQPADSTSLLLASSERAVKDAIVAAKAGSSATGLAQKHIDGTDGFLAYRINFGELSNLVDSVKGNLAMFMGGSGELDKQLSTEEMRKLGPQAGIVGFKDGVIRLSSFQENKPKA